MAANAAGVSRALTAAGFVKSVRASSKQVRGWGESSAGFRAVNESRGEQYIGHGWIGGEVPKWRNVPTGTVIVEYTFGSWDRSANRDVLRAEILTRMTDALVAKGYTVETKTRGAIEEPILHVTREG